MLIYKCKYCEATKFPDGKGCQCGASYASLRIVNENDELEKAAKKAARTGELRDLRKYLRLRRIYG